MYTKINKENKKDTFDDMTSRLLENLLLPLHASHPHRHSHARTCVVEFTDGMEGADVELETDNGEDDDGEKHQETDLQQRRHRLQNRFEHNLQAWQQQAKHRMPVQYTQDFTKNSAAACT